MQAISRVVFWFFGPNSMLQKLNKLLLLTVGIYPVIGEALRMLTCFLSRLQRLSVGAAAVDKGRVFSPSHQWPSFPSLPLGVRIPGVPAHVLPAWPLESVDMLNVVVMTLLNPSAGYLRAWKLKEHLLQNCLQSIFFSTYILFMRK